MRIAPLAVVCACAAVNAGPAKVDPPFFLNLISQDPGDVSALSSDCVLDDVVPGDALCRFTQTRVSLKLAAADVPSRISEMRQELDTEFFHNGRPTQKLVEFCRPFLTKEASDAMEKVPESGAKEAVAGLFDACRLAKRDVFERMMTTLIETETRTCRITTLVDDSPKRFSRVGPTKWIHTGVSGLCNSAITIVLETDKQHGSLWTYTQVRSARDDGPLCDGLDVGKPLVYSWKGNIALERRCDRFEF